MPSVIPLYYHYSNELSICGTFDYTHVPYIIDALNLLRSVYNTQFTQYTKYAKYAFLLLLSIECYVLENGGKKQDSLEFIDNVYEILRAKPQNDIHMMTHDIKVTWDPELKQYFKKTNRTKDRKFCLPICFKIYQILNFSEVTTNQSEGFNWLMKDLTYWREAPMDCVVLLFRFLQQYYLCEIKQGLAG